MSKIVPGEPYRRDWIDKLSDTVFWIVEAVGCVGLCFAFYYAYCLANPPAVLP